MEIALSSEEIEEKLSTRPLWKLRNGKLYRHFQTKNFHEGMNFLTTIGHIADTHHHHPDIHLTSYKFIEIELSTPRVHGITNMDFQMADLFDAIPVEYSLLWKRAHPELPYEEKQRLPIPPSPSSTHKYATVFPRRVHRPESLVAPIETSVHTQPISDDPSSVHHPHPFLVPTTEHTPLGQSDIQHHAEAYARQRPRSSSGSVLIRRRSSSFESKLESEAWNQMAHALQSLVDRGYDVGISTALLPMVNAHEVYPSWEDEMHTAYVHLNKRLSPAWLETEPPEVIAACKEFIDGYNTIFADNFMT